MDRLYLNLRKLLISTSEVEKMEETRNPAQSEPKAAEKRNWTNAKGDPMALASSDHPGMQIVTTPLTGNNYLSWSRAIIIALGAKGKLGFIDGTCMMPDEESADYDQWSRVDRMIISWILNSISTEIVDEFIYATTARELWMELEERYGEPNGPQIYQIQREINTISQGNLPVEKYFTKLKKLWDELICVQPVPECTCKNCTCGFAKTVADQVQSTRLMQFLMGLNDGFEHVKNQILIMEPLPSVNKAYYMALRVEKQREVNLHTVDTVENTTLFVKAPMGKGINASKGNQKKSGYNDKRNGKHGKLFCDLCKMSGHTRDKCFKLHGYPDWYKERREQRNKAIGGRIVANMADNPLDVNMEHITSKGNDHQKFLSELTQQELSKMMKGKTVVENSHVNLAHMEDFAEDSVQESALDTLKILSYNVWFREDMEMQKRMQGLGELIQQHSPDFIAFQEVTPNIFHLFRQSNWWSTYKCSVSDAMAAMRPYFCMLLSKLPVKSFSCKSFDNSIMGRELCIADIDIGLDLKFLVATSHLESPCPGPPTWDQMFSKERVDQAMEALELLKESPNVVFGGDMNWDEMNDGPFPLYDKWVDAWANLRPGENGWTYDTKANLMLSGNRTLQKRLDRFLCKLKDFRISHIEMIGQEAIPGISYIKEKKVRKEVRKLQLPVLPSDHYGLLLTITKI